MCSAESAEGNGRSIPVLSPTSACRTGAGHDQILIKFSIILLAIEATLKAEVGSEIMVIAV